MNSYLDDVTTALVVLTCGATAVFAALATITGSI